MYSMLDLACFTKLNCSFDCLPISQWLETGVPGCRGALVVRRVERACKRESVCVTAPHLLLMGHHARGQTPRLKCAQRGTVLVRNYLQDYVDHYKNNTND